MIDFFKNIFKIGFDEFIRVFRDAGTVLIMVVSGFGYSLVYSMPYLPQVVNDIPVGVADFDNSSISREIVRDIEASPYLKIVSYPQNLNEAEQEIFQHKIFAFISIPEDFSKNITKNKPAVISLYEDSSFLIIYKQITTQLNTIVSQYSKKTEIKNIIKEGINAKSAINTALPFGLSETPLFNFSGGYENYIFPAVLILIMQQTLLVGAGMLGGTDRERNFFARIKEKEIPKYVIGRALAYSSVYLIHTMMYFVIFPKLYGYTSYDNYFLILPFVFIFLMAVSFMGQACVYFFTTRESSLFAFVMLSLPLVFLPGIIWPKQSLLPIINIIADFIPSTTAMNVFVKINQMGACFSETYVQLFGLIGLMVLYFFIACFVFKILIKNSKLT